MSSNHQINTKSYKMSTVTQQSTPSTTQAVKRQPNRPKEVIAAEKAAKAERKQARDAQNESQTRI